MSFKKSYPCILATTHAIEDFGGDVKTPLMRCLTKVYRIKSGELKNSVTHRNEVVNCLNRTIHRCAVSWNDARRTLSRGQTDSLGKALASLMPIYVAFAIEHCLKTSSETIENALTIEDFQPLAQYRQELADARRNSPLAVPMLEQKIAKNLLAKYPTLQTAHFVPFEAVNQTTARRSK